MPHDDMTAGLDSQGFVYVADALPTIHEANELAHALVEASRSGPLPLSIVGDFVVPPWDGGESRDFQTLHFDFGLPLDPKVEQDVARYTALYVPTDIADVQAVTRLVPLAALLGQRSWPPPDELVERMASYGRTHGAWDDDRGYVEGSLARIVEAADAECPPCLPSVKIDPGFLCGLEFDSLRAEFSFFERHGMNLHHVEISIALQPGQLLIFDNLVMAHGRCGTRRPGELRQRVFGHRLPPAAARTMRDGVLTAFYAGRSKAESPLVVSIP